jgi:hypothetical protein
MSSLLRVTRVPYEEPYHLDLVFEAAIPGYRATVEVYTSVADVRDAGERLARFPDDGDFHWEIGDRDPARSPYHLALHAWRLDGAGHGALAVRFASHGDALTRRVAEFAFQVVPADLDRLARQLRAFAELRELVLEWRVAED